MLLDCLPGRKFVYLSHDATFMEEHQLEVSVELLNIVDNGSLLPHIPDLKIVPQIRCIRNIDLTTGICNGARLVVTSVDTNILEVVINNRPI